MSSDLIRSTIAIKPIRAMVKHTPQRWYTKWVGVLLMCLSVKGYALSMTVILPEGQSWSSVYQSWANSNVDQLIVQNLMRVDRLEQVFSEGLSVDQTQAYDQAMVITKANEARIIAAWQQALIIKRFEIDQLPVMIINDHAVYYGLNPSLALDAYKRMYP